MTADTGKAQQGNDNATGADARRRNDELSIVGLSAAEQAVYEAAVATGAATLAQLEQASDLRSSEARAAVDMLRAKGLLSKAPGKADRYIAAPPDVALEALLLEKQRQVKQTELLAQLLMTMYESSAPAEDPARLVEVVVGREAVMRQFVQIQRSAKREIRIIDKPPYGSTTPDENVSVEQDGLAAGIRWRAVYDREGLESFHHLNGDVRFSIDAGEHARVIREAPTKLIIADDTMAMLPLQAAPAGIDSSVVVYPSALLDALSELFEQVWRQALPLWSPKDDLAPSQDIPTADELQLLGMLTAGLSDDAIAEHLGLSPRTYQRRLRSLFERLEAQTRFQAALRAAALGWLPSEHDPEDPDLLCEVGAA